MITDSIESLQRFQESGIQNASFLAFMDVKDRKTIEIFEEFNNNLVDLSEYVAEANQMVRNFYSYEYLEFIKVFLLQLDKKESSDVAFLDFTERSPFKGTLANQLYILSLTHLVMLDYETKAISVELKDDNLNRVILSKFESSVSSKKIYLRYLIQVLRFFLSNYILPKGLGLLMKSKIKLTNCFFTIYPYWWLRSFTSNPEERFFPNIGGKTYESKSGYLTWLEDLSKAYGLNDIKSGNSGKKIMLNF